MQRRRRHPHPKRQNGFFLQPGAGLLLDDGAQNNQDSLPVNTVEEEQSTMTPLGHNANPTIVENTETGQFPPGSSATSSSLASTDAYQTMATLLFAPSLLSTGSISDMSSTIPSSTSAQQLSSQSSESLISSDSAPASSSTASVSSASASMSATPLSASSSSASASTSPFPIMTVSRHSPEFYVGLSFIGIVVLACLVSFASWMVRSRRSRSTWCGGTNENGDVENQDFGFGLGLYLDKSSESKDHFVKASLSSIPEAGRSVQPSHATIMPPASAYLGSSGRSPLPPVRPSTAQGASSDSLDVNGQLLGPLHIKNYMPGDFSSSCDELAKPSVVPRKDSVRTRCATPREAQPGSNLRFRVSNGRGPSVHLPPLGNVSSSGPKKLDFAHGPPHRSTGTRDIGDGGIPPLPMPPFRDNLPVANKGVERADSWGNTLRTSIFNALSGLTGGTDKPPEDRYTALPASSSRCGRWHEALFPRKDALSEREPSGSPSNPLEDMWTSPNAKDARLPFSDDRGEGMPGMNMIGLGLSVDDGLAEPVPGSTRPLKLQKKRPHDNEQPALHALSRASSMYSQPATDVPTPLHSRGSKASVKCRHTFVQTAPPRPAFLRRVTGSSATSFSSDCSDTSRELGAEELMAKRMMRLRARRKQQMSATIRTGRRRTMKKPPGSVSSQEGT